MGAYLDSNLTPADESFKDMVSSIGRKIDELIDKLRRLIQKIMNFVSGKVMSFLHMDTVWVNQKYYNQMMDFIRQIMLVDMNPINKVILSYGVIRNNEDIIRETTDKIQSKVRDLEFIHENIMKVTPSESNTRIQISTSKMKTLQSYLYDLRDEAQKKIQVIQRMKRNPEDSENLKYTQAQVLLLARSSAVDMKKSQMCIDLVTKIMQNSHKEKDSKKEQNTSHTEDSVQGRIGSMEETLSILEGMEIAEEKLSDANKMYKSGSKSLDDKLEEIKKMPENTSDECLTKRKEIYSIRNEYDHLRTLIIRLKPDKMEELLINLNRAVAGSIDSISDAKIRGNAYNLTAVSPNLASVVTDILICVGGKWIARNIAKGTKAEKGQVKICQRLLDKYNDLGEEWRRLDSKYTDLKQKETEKAKEEQSKKASESFVSFCDGMFIATEGLVKKTSRHGLNFYQRSYIHLASECIKILNKEKSKLKDEKKITEIDKAIEDLNKFKDMVKTQKGVKGLLNTCKSYANLNNQTARLTHQDTQALNMLNMQNQQFMQQMQQQEIIRQNNWAMSQTMNASIGAAMGMPGVQFVNF